MWTRHRRASAGGTPRVATSMSAPEAHTLHRQVKRSPQVGVERPKAYARPALPIPKNNDAHSILQLASDASQFRFVERDRAVIVQATKFLLPFLVVGDLVATPVKLQHIRADALKRGWAARHPGIGCDETHQKADADQEGACDRSKPDFGN